jgi:uracil-DNA glycosylase
MQGKTDMKHPWPQLNFWKSGEWQVVEERLHDLEKQRLPYNPGRDRLFAALDEVPFDDVRIAIIGQDPYPQSKFATGVAFSIPADLKEYPSSLVNIFTEYSNDLHYNYPTSGDLTEWCARGVLLWNAVPSCLTGKPASHRWLEWEFLTKEIVEKLNEKGIVFIFLGAIAREFKKYTDDRSKVIEASHPSPLGVLSKRTPFFGSRIFTTANTLLVEQGLEPIDWRLP